jgi:hypothetical protein
VKKPKFKNGDRVRYRGRVFYVLQSFWADAPGDPDLGHIRYYVAPRVGGVIFSAPEWALHTIPTKLSLVPTPENGTLPRPEANSGE